MIYGQEMSLQGDCLFTGDLEKSVDGRIACCMRPSAHRRGAGRFMPI